MTNEPVLAMASSMPEAFRIAEHSLALMGKGVRILQIPLLGARESYPDYRVLTSEILQATQSLVTAEERVTLSMCVTRETVSFVSPHRRSRRLLTVGLVGVCYRGGPLGIYSAEDWLPPEEDGIFRSDVTEILEQMQGDEPPSQEVVSIAHAVGNSLMAYLPMPNEVQTSALN